MRDRSIRRHHDQRMKAKAVRLMRRWFGPLLADKRATSEDQFNLRHIGVLASTHFRPCGCWGCQATDGLSIPDRRNMLNFREGVWDPTLPGH